MILPTTPEHHPQLPLYVLALIKMLEARFARDGALDEALADKIESLLWPPPSEECSK